MISNFDLSHVVLKNLYELGIRQLVVCAGARNAPLVFAAQKLNSAFPFQITSYFEERSAAFYALGLIRATQAPVAVITTSGTAAAELLPAVIEAYYQRSPLVVVTADRPKNYRGSAAPQSIEQIGLFSRYVEKVFDLDQNQTFQLQSLSLKSPVHLNVCFDEPLIDTSTPNVQVPTFLKPQFNFDEKARSVDFGKIRKPFVIATDFSDSKIQSTKDIMLKWQAPIYFESLSPLRNDPDLQHLKIKSSDLIIKSAFQGGLFDSIIRIGAVPTLRFWRDLEKEFSSVPVIQFTDLGFSGLARDSKVHTLAEMTTVKDFNFARESASELNGFFEADRKLHNRKIELVQKYPSAEPSLVNQLSADFSDFPVYLGNSLPIRLWDSFSTSSSTCGPVYANRGANGIDGQLSTFIGWAASRPKSMAVVGDLTALYDLASLGLSDKIKNQWIFILNNQGGRIFDRVFKGNKTFLNTQLVNFRGFADLWKVPFFQVSKPSDIQNLQTTVQASNLSGGVKLVEIVVDIEQTNLFWDEWDQACNNLKF